MAVAVVIGLTTELTTLNARNNISFQGMKPLSWIPFLHNTCKYYYFCTPWMTVSRLTASPCSGNSF